MTLAFLKYNEKGSHTLPCFVFLAVVTSKLTVARKSRKEMEKKRLKKKRRKRREERRERRKRGLDEPMKPNGDATFTPGNLSEGNRDDFKQTDTVTHIVCVCFPSPDV